MVDAQQEFVDRMKKYRGWLENLAEKATNGNAFEEARKTIEACLMFSNVILHVEALKDEDEMPLPPIKKDDNDLS